jgi:UDP-N-acetylmuramoyl-L-alanyl-D-glutamate--2,6-diaminopimelate ligase
MKLQSLLQNADVLEIKGPADPDIAGVCHDSRKIAAGHVFVAMRGLNIDGHRFLHEVARAGAAALIIEDTQYVPPSFKGTVVKVKDTRRALETLAATFFGNPSAKLFVAGVTGTNGKTTTTLMIEAVLNKGLGPTGVMGTIDYHLGESVKESTHTTPDALDLQETLADWVKQGARGVAMEVSSHALEQGRADAVEFDVGIFTNLTRDHLDFHGTMEKYRDAKSILFRHLLENGPKKSKRALLNGDDAAAKFMVPPSVPYWTFGMNEADITAKNIQMSFEGTTFDVVTPTGTHQVSLKMVGRHNVLNSLGAIGVGLHLELPFTMIAQSLAQLSGVRGRLQRVPSASPVRCFVDYAHTDDALINVLTFLRQLRDETSPKARIITLFGCGGDRDKGKRPLMLKAAKRFSDVIVVTSDNPRTEDPSLIIRDIVGQGDHGKNTLVEVDRRKAIELALKEAKPQDVVLIAGKGHEDYQIIGQKKYPFDDVKVAQEFLK